MRRRQLHGHVQCNVDHRKCRALRWYKDGSPTRYVPNGVASYNNEIAIAHSYNADGTMRCNSDLDRIHHYGDRTTGIAYYENGNANDCYYATTASKITYSRVAFRE